MCEQHVRFGYEASRYDAIEIQRQRQTETSSSTTPATASEPWAKSPCPREGKGSPLKWLVYLRPEGRSISGRVGCSCRWRWLWLTLRGRRGF
jgi:hypothetical protein